MRMTCYDCIQRTSLPLGVSKSRQFNEGQLQTGVVEDKYSYVATLEEETEVDIAAAKVEIENRAIVNE